MVTNLERPEHRVARALRDHRDTIVSAWEAEVRRLPAANRLEPPALRDHVPTLLDCMADAVEAMGRPCDLPVPGVELHSIARLDAGFDLHDVLDEMSILRGVIFRMCAAAALPPSKLDDFAVVDQVIDRSIAGAIATFARARDRTLAAIDRITSAAFESWDLPEFLQRLLGVLRETTPAVDTAVVYLREGEVLRARAAVGVEQDLAAAPVLRMGEGYAGAIAASGEPSTLGLEPNDPRVKSKLVREAGIIGIHGVPLVGMGQVIGVAYMGSRTARTFSEQDRRLFAALAARAAQAIHKYLLREVAERASAELAEREAQLRTLADNIPQLAWIADEHGTIVWHNRRWVEYTGAGAATAWDFVEPEHVARVRGKVLRAASAGQPWEDTFPLRGRDGRYRWFLSRATPIRDSAGAIVRWFGTSTDVTASHFLDAVTHALSQSLDYRGTLEHVAHLAVPVLADWCVVDVVEDRSPVRVVVAHADPAKLADVRAWSERYPPDWDATRGVGQVIRTGEPEWSSSITEEVLDAVARDPEHRHRLGAVGIRAYMIVPLRARDRTLGAITLLSTESDRTYSAADLEVALELGRRAGIAVDNARLYDEAQRAVKAREDVLAIVSHDLRSPLMAIDFKASHLLQRVGGEPPLRRDLDAIRRTVARMSGMIDDLLDMASIQAGRLAIKPTSVDADAMVGEVLDVHEPLALDKGLAITRALALEGVTLRADHDRLVQVLGNLLSNAIKFSPAGASITVRAARAGDRARFEVSDTGPGIPAAELSRVFEPYWSGRRREKKGVGLGLYIAKGIVEAHGGELHVDSVEGQGATFWFTVPVID